MLNCALLWAKAASTDKINRNKENSFILIINDYSPVCTVSPWCPLLKVVISVSMRDASTSTSTRSIPGLRLRSTPRTPKPPLPPAAPPPSGVETEASRPLAPFIPIPLESGFATPPEPPPPKFNPLPSEIFLHSPADPPTARIPELMLLNRHFGEALRSASSLPDSDCVLCARYYIFNSLEIGSSTTATT